MRRGRSGVSGQIRHPGLAATLCLAGLLLGLPAGPIQAVGSSPQHGPQDAGAAALDVDAEAVFYTGMRVDEGGLDQAGGGSALLEPRAGQYVRIGLRGGHGGWIWGAAGALDGLQLPFRPPEPGWDPAAVGLSYPPELKARADELWLGYERARQGSGTAGWAAWLGRRRVELGAGTGLIGFPLSPGLDQVGGDLLVGPARYYKVVARMDPGERYLLAHQLDLGPFVTRWGALRLTGYELGVVSPRFAALAFTWIPLWPGYLTQDLHPGGIGNNDANFYIGVGGWLDRVFGSDASVQAEVLVDDMPQVPWKRQVYQLGAAVRLTLGARWELAYTRVNNFVLTFQVPALSLVDRGRPLAFPDGPDTDSLRLEWHLPSAGAGGQLPGEALCGPLLTGLSLEWRRRGQGRLGDIWEAPYMGFEAAKSQEFLSGTVEHALLAGVRARLAEDAELVLQAGPVWRTANVEQARSVLLTTSLVLR